MDGLRQHRLAAIQCGRQFARPFDGTHPHRLGAAADFGFLGGESVGADSGGGAHFVRQQRLAAECLGHVLQPGGDVDGVAERGEYHVIAVADLADDDLAAVDADAEADRFGQIVAEEVVEFIDRCADRSGGANGVAAGLARCFGKLKELVAVELPAFHLRQERNRGPFLP